MRVLHLVHQYLPEYVGGTERYTRSLAHALARRGHTVAVFYRRSAPGRGLAQREEDGVRVWAVHDGAVTPTSRFLATFRSPYVARAFERVLDAVQPDLVHVQHLMGLPVALLGALRRRGIPFVVTLHDYWWVCANAQLVTNDTQALCDGPGPGPFPGNCARCALARAGHPRLWPARLPMAALLAGRNALLRRALRRAAALVAPTAFVRDWYRAHGAPDDSLAVIGHGIPPWPDVAPVLSRGARFAYIGGLAWQKGVHVAVAAAADLDAELWIAGDASFDPAYVRRLRALAGPNTRFLGRLRHAEVWATLAQIDALLVPSLWYETFSLIVREAFAMGVPALVSDWGALAEAVRDGVDGLRLPPGDVAAWHAAMQRLAADPALRARLRSNVRPPMTLAEHVDRIVALYRRCG
jgi:glycosyltransferase involved in cell wall biosynthesis